MRHDTNNNWFGYLEAKHAFLNDDLLAKMYVDTFSKKKTIRCDVFINGIFSWYVTRMRTRVQYNKSLQMIYDYYNLLLYLAHVKCLKKDEKR